MQKARARAKKRIVGKFLMSKKPKYKIEKTYIIRVIHGFNDSHNIDGIMCHTKWECLDILKKYNKK